MSADESDEQRRGRRARTTLTITVTVLAVAGTAALGATVVWHDPDDAQDVFNGVVPLVATWVGTVLAFYFGRENFESANREIREIVRELSPDERARQPATAIMRPTWNLTAVLLPGSAAPETATVAPTDLLATLTVDDLKARCVGNVSRLPILRPDGSVAFMVHESRLDQHVIEHGSASDTLAGLVDTWAALDPPVRFDHGHGFVTVPETATVAEVKHALDSAPAVQDAFVTRAGRPDGEMLGWISNLRLARYLPI